MKKKTKKRSVSASSRTTKKAIPVVKAKKLSSMTPQEARVAIAKDALAQIRLQKLKPVAGCYIGNSFNLSEKGKKDEISKAITKAVPKNCEVCALGSMFISSVNKFNHITLEDITIPREGGIHISEDTGKRFINEYNEQEVKMERESITKYLGRWFSQEQLDMIETAFEGDDINGSLDDGIQDEVKDWREALAEQYDDNTDGDLGPFDTYILVKILENIVKHNGTFTPKVTKKVTIA